MFLIPRYSIGSFLFEEEGGGGSGGSGSGAGGSGGSGGSQQEQWTPPTREEYEATVAERDRAKQAAANADAKRRDLEREQAQGDSAKELAQAQKERDELKTENDMLKTAAQMEERAKVLNRVAKAKDTEGDLVIGLLSDEDYESDAKMGKAIDKILEKYPRFKNDSKGDQGGGRGSLPGGSGGGGPADKSGGMNAAIRQAAGRG